jgi:uncharacterized protein YndB with AHSA1/START domain
MRQAETSVVEKSVWLPCAPAAAFVLFTEEISAWWPPERRHTQDPHSQLRMSPGGRFWESDRQGREVDLGRVLAWEPPGRLLLAWFPGTDAEHPTEVEVRFFAEEGGTRVAVCHRPTTSSAGLFGARAPRYATSWDLVLGALAGAAGLSSGN